MVSTVKMTSREEIYNFFDDFGFELGEDVIEKCSYSFNILNVQTFILKGFIFIFFHAFFRLNSAEMIRFRFKCIIQCGPA